LKVSGKRNLHRMEIRCKFLLPETFKHSRPIKPHNFGHAHRCKFLVLVSWACVTPFTKPLSITLRFI